MIASSPTDLQRVFDVVAENVARLCDSNDATIHRVDGNLLRRVANYGPVPVSVGQFTPSRIFPAGRAVIDQQTVHVHDVTAEIKTEVPQMPFVHHLAGTRTVLATRGHKGYALASTVDILCCI